MRIILASRNALPQSIGGGEVHMLALAKAFKKQGHDVSILTVDGTVDKTKYIRRSEFSDVAIDYISVPKNLSKYHRDDSLTDWADKWLVEQNADILHLFLFSNLLGLIPAARNLNIPVFLTALEFSYFCRRFDLMRNGTELCVPGTRGSDCEECSRNSYSRNQRGLATMARLIPAGVELGIRNIPIKLLNQDRLPALGERTITTQIDAQRISFSKDITGVIAPSSIMKRFYIANEVPESKIHFVPYGTDVKPLEFSTNGNGHKALRIGYIGRFHPLKGIHVLCDAVKQLPREYPIEVQIFGPAEAGVPGYSEQIQSFIKEDGRIKIRGSLDREGVPQAYRNLDVLVVPSTWYENSPITMSEALACKCPVICSDTAGMTDLVEDGVNGLTFPVGDSAALAKCLRRLVEETGLLGSLRKNIKPIETTEEIATKISSLYRNALGKTTEVKTAAGE
ncbi:MAG TPA: glycosyltransferase [Blastocatellia bacterium]|nr:glycosyltransferase [Blastocatellia bacterium]